MGCNTQVQHPVKVITNKQQQTMRKDQLIEAITSAPDCLDIEVAVKGDNSENVLYRRVIEVERRHREDIGRDVISLICLKSLKDEKEHFAAEDKARRAERKKILSDAALLDQQPRDQKPKQSKARKKKAAADNGKGDKYDNAFDCDNVCVGTDQKPKKALTFADMQGMVKTQLEQAPGDYDSVFDNFGNTFNGFTGYEDVEETPKNQDNEN